MYLAGKLDRRVSDASLIGRESVCDAGVDDQRRQKVVKSRFEIDLFALAAAGRELYFDGKHSRFLTQFSVDRGRAVLRHRADGCVGDSELERVVGIRNHGYNMRFGHRQIGGTEAK